ncbi:MAG: type I-E CRISPR-associated protein Cse2/CasB [Rhodocyclaceae bacterium]|nr:type I-E CRISPR-associated protein Cse2/CasB [Rhodocyclaceae bacterium]
MNLTPEMLRSEEFKNVLWHWWQSLEDDRGQRAELRRCRSPEEVYVSAAYRDHLVRRLEEFARQEKIALDENDLLRLALPVGVLARARVLESGTHFAALFARRGKGSPAMRDVRFRQVLALADGSFDALFTMLTRLVRLMDNAASLPGLLECGLFWNDATRVRWAKEYYPNRAE